MLAYFLANFLLLGSGPLRSLLLSEKSVPLRWIRYLERRRASALAGARTLVRFLSTSLRGSVFMDSALTIEILYRHADVTSRKLLDGSFERGVFWRTISA